MGGTSFSPIYGDWKLFSQAMEGVPNIVERKVEGECMEAIMYYEYKPEKYDLYDFWRSMYDTI